LLQSPNNGTANLSQKATECGECCQPLEEWEAGFCEGCYLQENNGQKICRSALLD
jgi:hypothetical protein